jgi:ATP-binding cassette subfamily B protein
MPAGLEQIVGETGWQLSHGERSLIFIARTLLADPQLIVLDESLGALDSATHRRALDRVLAHDAAVLVITH